MVALVAAVAVAAGVPTPAQVNARIGSCLRERGAAKLALRAGGGEVYFRLPASRLRHYASWGLTVATASGIVYVAGVETLEVNTTRRESRVFGRCTALYFSS